MSRFKIKINEFILIMSIAMPIGVYIYVSKSEILNVQMKFNGGYAVTVNQCEADNFKKIRLFTNYDILFIKNKLEEEGISILLNDENIFTINKNIHKDNSEKTINKFYEIKFVIETIENNNFNEYYKKSKIHCGSLKKMNIFNMLPASSNAIISENYKHKKIKLYFLMILPIVILYLILIACKFILENRAITNAKIL